jgi:uncharacterized membrane protein
MSVQVQERPFEPRADPHPVAMRWWEIDAARGVAIVMMVVFHLMWDLWRFGVLPNVTLYAGFWKYFQRTTAITFLVLVGVSLTVSYRRARRQTADGASVFLRFFWRGLRILGLAAALSLVVWGAGLGYIHFGVLHLIGVSVILAYPLLGQRWLNLLLWAIFYIAGSYIQSVRVDFPWLVWLGLQPLGYAPNDYFPLIPWFGVVLLGVFAGNTFYRDNSRLFQLPDLSHALLVRFLQFLGRHSLLIYLIHQPLLLAALWIVGMIRF